MAAQVLGISGSPIARSNTDRAVEHILEATGLETEFVKLSRYELQPCRACLGCKESNDCVVRDDGRALAEKFAAASAFVLGAFTPYSSLDARTKSFMERMYCLRHQSGLSAGKIGAAVVTTACPPGREGLPPAADIASSQIGFWMMEEGMQNLGTMIVLGNVPCIKCGHGDECAMSGIAMIHGEGSTVASAGVSRFEDDAGNVERAEALGRQIAAAVEAAAAAAS